MRNWPKPGGLSTGNSMSSGAGIHYMDPGKRAKIFECLRL